MDIWKKVNFLLHLARICNEFIMLNILKNFETDRVALNKMQEKDINTFKTVEEMKDIKLYAKCKYSYLLCSNSIYFSFIINMLFKTC